ERHTNLRAVGLRHDSIRRREPRWRGKLLAMSRPAADLLTGSAGTDAALDVALSAVLLDAVAGGRRPATIRIYRPVATVAFGRRDSFAAGFGEACRAASV